MNMIFNKSDLVGYEAVDTRTAKKEALAKLVAAWESKQAKNAKRFGGLGLLAVSLAACNSSDDTTTTTTTTTPTTTTPTVTVNNLAFTDDNASGVSPDVFTGTTGDDNPTATATGAAAETLDAADVITDPSSTDNDTLTVTMTGAATSPAIVSGIENVVYNAATFGAASAIAVDNVYGASITVNNTQLGGSTTVNVTGLGNGSTLNLGSQTTGAVTVTGGNGAATVNAGTGAVTMTAISADGATINAVNTGTVNLDVAAATGPATVNAAVGAAVSIDADSGNGGDKVSMLTLGNGGTFTITDAPDAYTMSGASGGIVKGTNAMFTGLALTDSTTGGTTTVQITDIAGGGAQTIDMDAVAADIIEITGDANSAAGNLLNVASGATVQISDALGHALEITTVLATPGDTAEVLNLNLTKAPGQAIDVDDYETITVTTSGTATTANITAAATATLTLNGSTALTLNTATTANTIDASAYTGAITHTVTAANADNVTYGTGNDDVTVATGETATVNGGSGDDTLTITGDMDAITFSNFEVITAGGAVTNSDASQWAGKSAILNGGNSITIDSADVATIDLSGYTVAAAGDFFVVSGTLDATKLASSTGLIITGTKGTDNLTGTANADTINGGDGVDTINGAAGNDTIDGGAGDDLITLGAGNDTVTGGAGNDDFITNKTDYTATTAATIAAAVDKITDFTVATSTTDVTAGDEIDNAANITTVASAGGAVTGTAQIATAGAVATFAAADDTLAEKVTAIEAAINAGGAATDGQAAMFMDSGNTYVFISEGTDGLGAGDALIELTGFDATGKTLFQNGNDAFIA